MTALVVFCPCSLVLATPTAMMAAIGNATKKGILIKSGAAVEAVSRLDTFVMDKTGTLTYGRLQVEEPWSSCDRASSGGASSGCRERGEILRASPGKAIVAYARSQGISAADPERFEMRAGQALPRG